MEFELGLSLPTTAMIKGSTSLDLNCAGIDGSSSSVLLWNGGPNEEDKWRKLHFHTQINNDEDKKEIVGWPPISWMRKELVHTRRRMIRNSMYVKVKMQGVAISRKVNLALFNSHPALTNTLINMFAKCTKIDHINSADYTVLYQDKQGDWMLAGDVPWERAFVESVRRIEVVRSVGHY